MTRIIGSIAAAWIVCGVLAYGITFADFQAKAPEQGHHEFAIVMASGGPVGLLVSLVASDYAKHGLQWR